MRSFTVAAFLLLQLISSSALAEPGLVPLQGYLTDLDGVPIDGAQRLTFKLFNAATDGDELYTEDLTSVDVSGGQFIVYLGNQTALDLDLFRDNPDLWLEILVGGSVISPRTRLGATPYAGFASYCGDAATVGGKAESELAAASHEHDWSELTSGVPAGLADGDDTLSMAEVDQMANARTFAQETLDAQILAQAMCAALSGNGFAFAVPRDCGGGTTCAALCASLSEAQAGTLSCINAVHVYANQPATAVETLGLKTYVYGSCADTNCGPNYCCCEG